MGQAHRGVVHSLAFSPSDVKIMLATGASLREDYSCTVRLRGNRKPHFDYGEFSDESMNGYP